MRALHFFFCTLVVCAAALPCVESAAQPAGSAKAGADTKTAADDPQRLYQQGVDAYKRGDVRGAEPLFLKAWALAKTYDVAANLGVVEMELKKYREAAELFAFSARNATPSVKPAQRESTRQALEEAKKHILTVRVSVNVDGAALSVDGVAVAPELSGPELYLAPGKHLIEATADKHEPAQASVDGAAGASVEVTLALKEKAAPLVPIASATATGSATAPPQQRSLVPAYVIGGAGLAGLIAGGVMLGVSGARKADAEQLRDETVAAHGPRACAADALPVCATQRQALTEASALFNGGAWALIGGGVALAGGLTYWFVARSATDRRTGARVMISPSGATIAVQGSF